MTVYSCATCGYWGVTGGHANPTTGQWCPNTAEPVPDVPVELEERPDVDEVLETGPWEDIGGMG